MNLAFIGLPGSGKTTVGRAAAALLGMPFFDCDDQVERRAGMPIPTIFAVEGECWFRHREAACLEQLLSQDGAVIATGTIITRATPVYDLVNETVIRPIDGVLHVPENAVVVPGSRAVDTPFARQNGLSLYAPIIVKYRDDKTAASVVLESILR